jgi:alpha-tubulin suppressor-like RCC1 family protein
VIDGRGYCWGTNAYGRLGDGTGTDRSTPAEVSGGLRFRELQAANLNTCGITIERIVYCWGDNRYGAVGDGTMMSRSTPARVPLDLAPSSKR